MPNTWEPRKFHPSDARQNKGESWTRDKTYIGPWNAEQSDSENELKEIYKRKIKKRGSKKSTTEQIHVDNERADLFRLRKSSVTIDF